MNTRSSRKTTVLSVLSVSLITSAAAAYFLTIYYRHVYFHLLEGFCGQLIKDNPNSRQTVLDLLKTGDFRTAGGNLSNGLDSHILANYGYSPSNLGIPDTAALWIAALCFGAGALLFFFSFRYWHRKSAARIRALTEYLKKINTGRQGLLLDSCEDEFSKLQDELYKTVTALYQTREEALTARNNFAENLSNIAHQLKTPITLVSLTVQMAKKHLEDTPALDAPQGLTAMAYKMRAYLEDIERQIHRLLHLEEALLLLSRIDAGTLTLDRKPADVFTILSLASDNLYELFMQKGVRIEIPEQGGADIRVDLDWTMEAVMNLMKNCMEAAETGTAVHCSYEKNPLYVQIWIWDEGAGFAKEDLPHLFDRFYRGKKAKNTGTGIGLSLSKAIIEMQNGIIRAFNLPNGGACFEIRFYTS